MKTPRAFAALASLALAFAASTCAARSAAAAEEQTASLSWVRLAGAEGCIGTRALARAVEARLARAALVSAARADLTIEGRIEPAAPGWRAVIAVADASGALLGTRDIATASSRCDAIDDDLALAIALMIDPNARLSPAPPAPAPAQPVAPVPATATARALPPEPPQVIVQRILIPAPAPPAPPPEPWRVGIEAGPVLSLGLLPSLGIGGAIRARLTPPGFWAIELGGVVWTPNRAESGASGTRFSWGEGSVSLCPLTVGAETRVSLCAGGRVGAMSAGGFGFKVSLAAERVTASGALEGRVLRRIAGPLVLGGGVALVVPFVRDTFYFTDTTELQREVFRMSPVAGTADVVIGVELP